MIKSLSLLTRRPELSHEQFMRHWVEIHAPLAHPVPGVRRYVQNHIQGERTRPDIPTTEVAIDGVAELWYDDRAAMDRANASPEPSGCTMTAPSLSAASRPSLSKNWSSSPYPGEGARSREAAKSSALVPCVLRHAPRLRLGAAQDEGRC